MLHITLEKNGYPGLAVLSTKQNMDEIIQTLSHNMNMTKQLYPMLKTHLDKVYSNVVKTKTHPEFDCWGDKCSKQDFDNDLCLFVAADYLVNGEQIAIVGKVA